MLNGITVHHDGRPHHLELDKSQAETFADYVSVAGESNSQTYPLSEEEVKARDLRAQTVQEHASTLKAYLGILGNLEERRLAYVLAFLDLLEYGDSWMRETICDLLLEVQFSGPAKANERNPREVLADVAYNLFDWWDNIERARTRVAQHPELFPPQATPDPAPETTTDTTGKPAKAQRARKPRKVAANA
jgi:hypothetical protein